MFWWRKKKSLPPARLWALAAGGILTKLNSEPFDKLRFECGRADSLASLREGWSVNDSQELTNTLHWLWEEGHRTGCDKLCRSLPQAGNRSFIAANQDPASLYAFMSSNLEELKASGLVGWDLSRLVNVARWGYTAAFVDETNAWIWISHAAQELQRSYRSWKALGRDFLLGYEFWRRSTRASVDFDLNSIYDWLLSSPDSPWRHLAWDTPLDT
jgi:hypothetical protein